MKYTLKISKKNQPMYYKDSKLCSKKDIPELVLRNLRENEPYEYERQEVKAPSKECIFCGEFAKYQRFINLQSVALCEEHVYSKTTGQIAHQMNKEIVNAT